MERYTLSGCNLHRRRWRKLGGGGSLWRDDKFPASRDALALRTFFVDVTVAFVVDVTVFVVCFTTQPQADEMAL